MATVIVILSRPLSNYCSLPSLNQLLFYVVPQASDTQFLILGVLPPGLNINCRRRRVSRNCVCLPGNCRSNSVHSILNLFVMGIPTVLLPPSDIVNYSRCCMCCLLSYIIRMFKALSSSSCLCVVCCRTSYECSTFNELSRVCLCVSFRFVAMSYSFVIVSCMFVCFFQICAIYLVSCSHVCVYTVECLEFGDGVFVCSR